MCDNKDMRPNVSIFGVFYFFITEKVRNAVQKKKVTRSVQRKCINGRPVSKLIFEISFRRFQHSGRLIEANEDKIKAPIETNQ